MSSERKERVYGLVIFKEIVTASLGLVIVIVTLMLLWPCLTASPSDITSAQGIFSILGGWGGVVLGYYFGRMPAERAAARAEEAVLVAREKKDDAEKIKSKVLASGSTRLVASGERLDEFLKMYTDLDKKFETYADAFESVQSFLKKESKGGKE